MIAAGTNVILGRTRKLCHCRVMQQVNGEYCRIPHDR